MTQAPIPKRDVAVINASTVLNDDVVERAVRAFQTQVSRDFAPVWGINADLAFFPRDTDPAALPQGSWWVVLLDNTDQAGLLGYHDLTTTGLPLGKVFARTDQMYHHHWTVTASHELLEMLVDPWINLTMFWQPDANSGVLYAYEVCDAVESDRYGYRIGRTLVTDFVYPAWFEPNGPQGGQMDHLSLVNNPLNVLPGGYIAFNLCCCTGWHQLAGNLIHGQQAQFQADPIRDTPVAEIDPDRARYAMRAPIGSRRERREIPRNEWVQSNLISPHSTKKGRSSRSSSTQPRSR